MHTHTRRLAVSVCSNGWSQDSIAITANTSALSEGLSPYKVPLENLTCGVHSMKVKALLNSGVASEPAEIKAQKQCGGWLPLPILDAIQLQV